MMGFTQEEYSLVAPYLDSGVRILRIAQLTGLTKHVVSLVRDEYRRKMFNSIQNGKRGSNISIPENWFHRQPPVLIPDKIR